MNFCTKCQSIYSQPGTCNCYAQIQPPIPMPQPLPYGPYPYVPTQPTTTSPWTTYPNTTTVYYTLS